MLMESIAGWLRVLLVQRKWVQANTYAKEVLDFLTHHPEAEKADEPMVL